MRAVKYKKLRFLRFTELLGQEKVFTTSSFFSDVIMEFKLAVSPEEVTQLITNKSCLCLLLPNYIIDLTADEEEIFKNMTSNIRRNIRLAMNKEKFNFQLIDTPTDKEILLFEDFYNQFAREVNIKNCDVNKLKAIRDEKSLVITNIMDDDGQLLCSQAYLDDGFQIVGLYLALNRKKNEGSKYNQLVGRANKYMHWKTILYFKNKGHHYFNFGGKIMDPKDIKGQNVNTTKKEFGAISGVDIRVFTANSLRGKLYLRLLRNYYEWKRPHETLYTKEIIKQNSLFIKRIKVKKDIKKEVSSNAPND